MYKHTNTYLPRKGVNGGRGGDGRPKNLPDLPNKYITQVHNNIGLGDDQFLIFKKWTYNKFKKNLGLKHIFDSES